MFESYFYLGKQSTRRAGVAPGVLDPMHYAYFYQHSNTERAWLSSGGRITVNAVVPCQADSAK